MSNTSRQVARLGANSLPLYRVVRGHQTAHRLNTNMYDPHARTWSFAARVAADAATDKLDGYLARYAGVTVLGSYADQLADKLWYLTILKQLVKNAEVDASVYDICRARDIGTTLLRPLGQLLDVNPAAQQSGKLKMALQSAGAVASCSPLADTHPELVRGLHEAGAVGSIVSGLEILNGVVEVVEVNFGESASALLLNSAFRGIGLAVQTARS
jgi:phosphatidylglycerophosphate synthase